ncbi:MAG: ABC transporter substrate-binding protein [Gammaproteobacteria bacterium]|nr:ABC transporter substrate-binding protein [Gammaproteobacteria bacterium]MBU1415640.1 ABC transporter substrate-binding protein [Gammaproteobacteria bacterium]
MALKSTGTRKERRKLSEYSLRDALAVAVPLLAIVIFGFWLASRFIQPAPPDTLTLSSGGDGGAYQRFAALYADVLARYDVKLIEQPSGGSLDNVARLRDEAQGVDAGFFQAGTAEPQEDDMLVSLGAFYYEPLWVFYRAGLAPPGGRLDKVLQLKGKRIAVGGAGGGSRYLAQEVLQANGIDADNTKLLDTGGLGLVEAFAKGEIDAAFVVGPTESAAVWLLLFADGVKLMSLTHADAYTRRFPYLSKVVLPRGAIDVGRDVPPADVTMVAATATLLVREDMHPALIDLLMQAAVETHGGPGVFQKPGEFPRPTAVGFPLSEEAARYYKSGKPLLQRYLPFWAATLIDRLVVMLIPVVALLLPLLRFAPMLYGWRVRSRIYRRYGELKFLEAEVEQEPARHTREEWLARLDAIEDDVHHLPTPLAFTDMLYTLRMHIGLVRGKIERRTATADFQPDAAPTSQQ